MTFDYGFNELLTALVFMPILAATAWNDLRQMKIPNTLSLAGLALFAICLPLLGWQTWLMHFGAGGVAFVICIGLFVAGWFGGGDAKMLPVTFLFVPTPLLALYLYTFAVSMLLGMCAIWAVRQKLASPDAGWVSMQTGAAFPMGIAIALSLPLTLAIAAIL